MSTTLGWAIQKQVATVRLEDPDGLHRLSSEALRTLDACLETVLTTTGLKAIILTASGDRCFSAGADLRELRGFSPEQARDFAALGQRVARRLAEAPVVTVAFLNGSAYGGGVELALACDLRVMVSTARLHYQAARLGVVPAWGGTQRLPGLIGQARARQALLLCEPIRAEEALAWGLVQACVRPADPAGMDALVEQLRLNDPRAVAAIKRALPLVSARDEEREREAFAACFEGPETGQRIGAWLMRVGVAVQSG